MSLHIQELNKNGHTLDVLITNKTESLSDISVVDFAISDHKTILFTLDVCPPKRERRTVVTRSVRSIDKTVFSEDLKKTCNEVSSLVPDSTVDQLVNGYNAGLQSVLDKHAPLETKRVSDRPATPWFGEEQRGAKIQRRKAESEWRKTGLVVQRQIFTKARGDTNNFYESSKADFYQKQFDECSNSKQMHSIVDDLQGKQKDPVLPNNIEKSEIPQVFSDFFVDKIKMIRTDLDKCSETPIFSKFDGVPMSKFSNVTENEIQSLIKHSMNKTCALDPLPTTLVKEYSEDLVPVLTEIINASLMSGVVPSELKQALVSPLLKKRGLDQNTLKNYRPVSNLPFVSKILERVVLKQLNSHLASNNLLEKHQSAYRQGHSTETALLDVTSTLLENADNGKVSILSLLDLSAAFDTIDHKILLKRLETTFGIEGVALNWFKSYMTDRKQTVCVKGTRSDPVSLEFGVPQGSVLGPILFSLYTQPIAELVEKNECVYHKFADDTQIGNAGAPNDFDEVQDKIEDCIDEVGIWMSCNRLKLNEDKTEALKMGTKAKCKSVKCEGIKVGNNDIPFKPHVKNLGVYLDSHLDMTRQVSHICSTSYLEIRRLGKIRKLLTLNTAKQLTCAQVLSRLDYGNSLLAGASKEQILRLQKVQNSAAKMVLRKKRRDHAKPLLAALHWLPVEQRIQYKLGTLAYRHFEGSLPPYLSERLTTYVPARLLRSSSDSLLCTPIPKLKTAGEKAFDYQAAKAWNSLPSEVRQSKSIQSFKKNLKTHLFRRNCS